MFHCIHQKIKLESIYRKYMILRFLLIWVLIINGGSHSEAVTGYFSGANHFYQDPASFLGWGSRSEVNNSAKSSGKAKGKSHSSTSSQEVASTISNKQLFKNGRRTTDRNAGEVMVPIPLSRQLEEMIRTGPSFVLDESTIHYIPLAQLVTASPSLFAYPSEQPESLSMHKIQPTDVQKSKVIQPSEVFLHPNEIVLRKGMSLKNMHLPQTYFQGVPGNSFQNKDLRMQQGENGATEEPFLQIEKNFRKIPHMPFPQVLRARDSLLSPKMEGDYRQTLFVNPRLVSMMRAMDHSLLSFPSRFDYRPLQQVITRPPVSQFVYISDKT